MGNGFPTAKFFRIINTDTGLCLAAEHGGTTVGSKDRWGGPVYAHTNNQVLAVSPVTKKNRGEIWFFDERKTHSQEFWHLVNANKDNRSAFALHVGSLDPFYEPVEVDLIGWGQIGQTQWKASEGMIWPGPHEDKVVTLVADGHDEYQAVVAHRGAPNQRWRFEEVELPGEAVPVERKGQYDTSERGEPGKWRAIM